MERFTRKPFKDRLTDTGFLLKNSFTIVGKDEDIKTPSIHMIVFYIITVTLMFIGIATWQIGVFVVIGTILFLIGLLILLPFSYFYNVRQKADQSWIVFNTLTGKDISYKDAHEHTKAQKGKLRFIAFIDILLKLAKNKNNRGFLANLILGFLSEVWDLLSHYMLPAVVIEQKGLKDVVPEIKNLKNNVPATLVGVFGIDFVGHVVTGILVSVSFVLLALSFGIGYLISLSTDITILTINNFSFSWVPIIVTLYLVFIIGGILKILVESIKVIYFTIFYTSITRPMDIQESIRDEMTHYLLMQKSDFEIPKKPNPQQQYNNQLASYIK